MTPCFPDINFWLALVVKQHVFNGPASAWWEQNPFDVIGFCRFTQLSLLRLLTNAAVMKGEPLTNRQAWKTFENLLTDERVQFLPEWPTLDSVFKAYSNIDQPATKLWSDAYLAAYASVNSATLVTFDKGFAKYPVQSLILPTS